MILSTNSADDPYDSKSCLGKKANPCHGQRSKGKKAPFKRNP